MNLSNKIVLIGNRKWNEYLTSLFLKTNGGKKQNLALNFSILPMNLKTENYIQNCTILDLQISVLSLVSVGETVGVYY